MILKNYHIIVCTDIDLKLDDQITPTRIKKRLNLGIQNCRLIVSGKHKNISAPMICSKRFKKHVIAVITKVHIRSLNRRIHYATVVESKKQND